MKFSALLLLELLCLGGAFAGAPDYRGEPRKKIIETSWVTPSTAFLRENIRTLEKYAPVDGIRIRIDGQGELDGQQVRCANYDIFGKTAWKYEWFAQAVDDLKNTEFRKFSDNFIGTTVMPGGLDWFDDAAWAAVCNNFGIMARIARETGIKGIIFDIEEYGKRFWAFEPSWGHSYEDTVLKVRQRGQEFAKAIFSEYPDMKLFCFWWLSWWEVRRHGNLNLVFAFINGVYDELPPGATVIEGDEFNSYTAGNAADYTWLRFNVDHAYPRMIDPANYRKYKSQTQLAPAIFMDAYVLHDKGKWFDPIAPLVKQYGRADAFRRNLGSALDAADEYVWTYAERVSWWPGHGNKNVPDLMEKKLPGITWAVESARNPLKYAPQIILNNRAKNLLKNPDFANPGNKKDIPEWKFWQNPPSNGTAVWSKNGGKTGNGAAVMKGTTNGEIFQCLNVAPGQKYLIRVYGQNNSPTARIFADLRWGHHQKGFNNNILNQQFELKNPDQSGWSKQEFVVTVPFYSDRMYLFLPVYDQGQDDVARFSNPEIYRLQ